MKTSTPTKGPLGAHHKHQYIKHNGILLMITASLFFSFMEALVKYTTQELPFMEVVFFRSFFMLLLLAPWMVYKKLPLIPKNKGIMFLRVASGFAALCMTFYVTSKINLADASILSRIAVIFVAILSALFLKERVTLRLTVYITCALIGAAFIVKPSWNIINIPGYVGVAAGFLSAVAYVSIKQLHKSDNFFTMVFHFALFGSTVSFALSHHQFLIPHPHQWVALIGIGIVATLAQLCMTYSYKDTDASIVSPYSFSTVLFSALWGLLFWGEIQDRWSIVGAILIIACGIGIMKLQRGKGLASPSPQPSPKMGEGVLL